MKSTSTCSWVSTRPKAAGSTGPVTVSTIPAAIPPGAPMASSAPAPRVAIKSNGATSLQRTTISTLRNPAQSRHGLSHIAAGPRGRAPKYLNRVMTMRLACSVTDFPDAPLDRAAEIASSAGFPAIELFLTWGEGLAGGMQSNPASHVRRTLGKHDLVLSGLNGSNLSAIDDAGAQAQLETLSSEIAYASELGLTSLNVKGGDRNQPMGRFKELLAEACKRLPEGFDLNLGNHCGNRVENPEDLTEILDGAPKCVRVLLDSGHFLSANVDPVYVAQE
ncbi:MAG: TIM barrel protein, partial [Armatimonadia bacterium]|nr:TIM barrel protein [Armatimonadia bacterium]